MSGDVNMRRSQAIMRLPLDSALATLILHDGVRSDVLLFIPPGEDITALLRPGDPFVPMIRDVRLCMVARDAIAVLGVVIGPERPDDDALPTERQRARVRLRCGTVLEGELRWTATGHEAASTDGHQRIADHVNDRAAFIVVHAAETQMIYYVAKSQVATVEELR